MLNKKKEDLLFAKHVLNIKIKSKPSIEFKLNTQFQHQFQKNEIHLHASTYIIILNGLSFNA